MEKGKKEEERISFLFTRNSIFSVANSFELRRSSILFIQYIMEKKNRQEDSTLDRMSKKGKPF